MAAARPDAVNTRDGPPSTWERYGVDANHDATTDIYDPEDAIPAAANYLTALLRANGGNLKQAILGYNHSEAYVRDVLARARTYARKTGDGLATATGDSGGVTGCAAGLDVRPGPANLRDTQRVSSPRAYRPLPSWALADPSRPGVIDARLYDDAVWILRRYHLSGL